MRDSVKDAKRVFTDDTGWRINGESAYLMGFDTDEATVYQIRSRHRNEEVRELIPSDYGGVMHADRAPTYDAWPFELVAQQKCCYHIIRSIDKVLEDKAGTVRTFGETLKALLKNAIALWHRYHVGGVEEDYTSEVHHIKQAIDRHQKPRSLDDTDNQSLLDQIGWHHAGGNLLRFLDQPEVAEPTNNLAERALRPGVIARKVLHCSKNTDGANAYEAFKTIIETAGNAESLWSAGSWTCSVPARRHLIRSFRIRFLSIDNLQPSESLSRRDDAAREAASLINYGRNFRWFSNVRLEPLVTVTAFDPDGGLCAEATTMSERPRRKSALPDPVDVVLLTALKDECDQVFNVVDGALGDRWEPLDGPGAHPVWYRRFAAADGTELGVLTTWATEMGEVASAQLGAIARLVQSVQSASR